MRGVRGFVLGLCVISCSTFSLASSRSNNTYGGGAATQTAPQTPPAPYSRGDVNSYISDVLHDRFEDYNFSYMIKDKLPFYEEWFSKSSAKALQEIIGGFVRSSSGNAVVVAKSGRGKTHLIKQLAAIFSYDTMPDYVKIAINRDNPYLETFYKEYLSKTQVIFVNDVLLGLDATPPGAAWPNAEERMKATLNGLFRAARDEFIRTKRRTLFVFDEIAVLPDLVNQAMKKPLDSTGFKNPNVESERAEDYGVLDVGFTTPGEHRRMVNGDNAIRRRWKTVLLQDMPDEEAFDVIRREADKLQNKFGGLELDDAAIGYLLNMNNILNSPPLAQPASGLAAVNDLYSWFLFNRSENALVNKITLKEAQRYLVHHVGLTDAWLPGPDGQQPFYDLAERVKALVADQDPIVEDIAMKLKAWVRLDFGAEIPVFMIGGPSGSGKNTIYRAFNQVLFGNNGDHLLFSLGAKKGSSIDELTVGTVNEPPLIMDRSEDGSPPAALGLDETRDAYSAELLKFKEFLATGRIQPRGRDSDTRFWRFPIFLLSQHGEELFAGLETDDEIAKRYDALTPEEIDNAFLKPATKEGMGEISYAVMQRVKRSGGVYVTKPVAQKQFPIIVDQEVSRILRGQKERNGLEIEVRPELRNAIVRYVILHKQGPRVLEANVARFVKTALSEASDGVDGVPLRGTKISMTLDQKGVAISYAADKKTYLKYVSLDHLLGKESVSCERLLSGVKL